MKDTLNQTNNSDNNIKSVNYLMAQAGFSSQQWFAEEVTDLLKDIKKSRFIDNDLNLWANYENAQYMKNFGTNR